MMVSNGLALVMKRFKKVQDRSVSVNELFIGYARFYYCYWGHNRKAYDST